MVRLLFPLCALLSLSGASPSAFAGFLRLVPTVDATADEAKRTVSVKWTITNEGDEAAREVGVEFSGLNETYPVAGTLPAGGSASMSRTFPFAAFGVGGKGDYLQVYRLLYRDLNMYGSSAVHQFRISLPPSPAQNVVMSFREDVERFAITGTRTLEAVLRNTGEREIEIDEVLPASPKELKMTAEGLGAPMKLGPQAEVPFRIRVERVGGLQGSTVHAFLAVSGVSEGKHFAETLGMLVDFVDTKPFRPTLLVAALAAALTVLFVTLRVLRGRRKSRPLDAAQ